MKISRIKKIAISSLVIGILVVGSVFSAFAGIAELGTPGVSQCSGGYLDWKYYSAGDTRYGRIDTYYWVYVNAFSGCTVSSKRAARSPMDPDHMVYGYVTAKYGGTTVYNNRRIVGHYFDVTKGVITREF